LDTTLRSLWPGEGWGSLLDADVTDLVTGLGGVCSLSSPNSALWGDVKSSLETAADVQAGSDRPASSTRSRLLGERCGVLQPFCGVLELFPGILLFHEGLSDPLWSKGEVRPGESFWKNCRRKWALSWRRLGVRDDSFSPSSSSQHSFSFKASDNLPAEWAVTV
jgi:hypothetical protein